MADEAVERAMLAEARAEVALADHKASMVLAALGIGFAAVLGGFLAGDWDPSELSGSAAVLWWVGAVLALASVIAVAAAVWPRFKTSDVDAGIAYWGHIATYKSLSALAGALDEQKGDGGSRTRQQLWRVSRIVRTKYNLVRLSFVLAGVAVALFLGAAAVGGWGSS